MEEYFATIAPQKVRPASLRHYRMAVRLYIVPALGKLRLAALTMGHVQAMLSNLTRQGLSPATVVHTRATLAVALQHALRERIVSFSAARLAVVPQAARRRVAALEPIDARRLIAAFEGIIVTHWLPCRSQRASGKVTRSASAGAV